MKEWEHTRVIAWMVYKSNADPKKSAKNMLAWWKLSTDKTTNKPKRKRGKQLTKAQKENFFNRMR